MRGTTLSICLLSDPGRFPVPVGPDDNPEPGDATLGAKPPAGAIVFWATSLEGWVQVPTTSPPRNGRSPRGFSRSATATS